LLVHAHSNGCDIGDMRQTLSSISESLKVHVMSFEFPGYGLHLGHASMRSIDEAASAVLDYIMNDLKVNLSQVVWYGRSIGSGPALRAVHRISKEMKQQPGGIVIQCGFANFPEVAGHLFGRVAKRLVSRLWPNEAMLKELHCPVLLIHGRNDTMIPIQQSEKLWNAVSMKELSHFHTCDCGHNDFNFRRCTLRPIYDFLLGVISASSFPATNFNIEVEPSQRAYVHHIGPLRSRIPVYSFRRPDLEDWLRRISNPDAAKTSGALTPAETEKADAGIPSPDLSPDMVKALPGPEADPTKQESGKLQVQGRDSKISTDAAPSPPPKRPSKGKKGKEKAVELPPIPDYSIMPAVEDVSKALLESEGLVITTARRLALFLERLQRQLDRIEGLENKSLEEVCDFVEMEYWASDPMLCLWEEVSLPHGERVRYRLGPFSVDNHGQKSFHPELATGSPASPAGPQLLRVPLWIFCPSQAHFRCLAEWSLVNSDRLRKQLPSGLGGSSPSCCCVPSSGGSKKKGKNGADSPLQPTKGALATSLAAHFVNWVEKNDDIRSMFERFTRMYRDPEQALQRTQMASPVTSRGPPPLKEMAGDTSAAPGTPVKGEAEEPKAPPPAAPALLMRQAYQATAGTSFPWLPMHFSPVARPFLLDGIGTRSATFIELSTRLRSQASSAIVAAERQEGSALPNLADWQSTSEYVSNPTLQIALAERCTDWATAGLLLHYDRLLCGAGPNGEMPAGTPSEEVGDPTRLEVKRAGLCLNKAIKAFTNADLRERRELQRLALRLPRAVAKPEADSESPLPPPAEEAIQNIQVPQSAAPATTSDANMIAGL